MLHRPDYTYLSNYSSPRASCLLGKPSMVGKLEFSNVLPGENFEVNKQCELQFGSGSKICSFMVSIKFPCYVSKPLQYVICR